MITRKLAWALLLVAAISCKPKTPVNPDGGKGTSIPTDPDGETPKETPKEVPKETPKTENEMFFPEDDYRSKQPVAQSPHAFKAPEIQQFALKNGVKVYLIERHQLPVVNAQFTMPGGSDGDPAKKVGLAGLCVSLMTEGTDKLDKVAFEEAQADIASSIGAFAGGDETSITFNTLSKNLDATLALWNDVLQKPGMRKEDFERLQKQSVVGVIQQKKSPGAIAGRLFGSIVYGPEHPDGRVRTEASLQAITLDECKKYVKDYIKPEGAKLYVLGDMTRAQVEDKFGKTLEGFKGKPKALAKNPAPKPRDGRIFFVDAPKAEQSVIYFTELGPKRQSPDYNANSLMAEILGGSFQSRININIREEHGYAYGAFGGFSYGKDYGTFFAGGQVRTDVTKESIQEILKEIKGIRDGEVKDEELARVKEGSILALPERWSTGFQILGTVQELNYFGLPLNYYDSYVQGVEKVNKAEVLKSAQANLDITKMKILVVGDREQVLPKLQELIDKKELGDGKLVILDADGVVQK